MLTKPKIERHVACVKCSELPTRTKSLARRTLRVVCYSGADHDRRDCPRHHVALASSRWIQSSATPRHLGRLS
jgi:hypothetical protein